MRIIMGCALFLEKLARKAIKSFEREAQIRIRCR